MLKIYLDTNVYSQIAKDLVGNWMKELKSRADKDLIFIYSQAHLNDLNSDKTENKFKELSAIRNFAKNNFIHEDSIRNVIKNSLLYPEKAFELYGGIQENVAGFMEDTFKETGDPLVDGYLKLIKLQQIDLGQDIEKQLTDPKHSEAKKMYNDLGIYKRYYSMEEWMPIVSKMMSDFETDNNLIKSLRRQSMKHLDVEKLNIKIGDVNFDENLTNSKLGKSFKEMLDQQISWLPENNDTLFNRITIGYNMLNFLGLDYEKNNKVKFKNTQNDGQHCYYGGTSDILVSNDNGLLSKSRFIYNYYKIDTKVMNMNQFEIYMQNYKSKYFSSEPLFLSSIEYDRFNSLILAEKRPIISHNQHEEIRALSQRYWGYFNRLSEVGSIDSNEKYLVLYKNDYRTGNITFFKEIDAIIEGISKMTNSRCNLLNEDDIEKICQGEWPGILWETDSNSYWLRYNNETGRIGLQLGPVE
ncbi:MAG: hypothetical protein R2830_12630 [Saprospiraceae bacterium]